MANKKISELSTAETLTGSELFPFAKSGDNGNVTSDTLGKHAMKLISQLPAITNPTGAEMIPVALDGSNGKLTLEQIVKGKVALFDDMWVKLTNGFTSIDRVTNPAKPYICNGVPLSYEDALVVAKYGNYEMAMNILDNRSWGNT